MGGRPSYDKDFKKITEGFRYNRGVRELFADWLEIAACAVHQEPYHAGLVPRDEDFDRVEAQYLMAVKKYTREELDKFATLLAITKMALWEDKSDFLGRIYMEMEMGDMRAGQFFTPWEVSLMMARITLVGVKEEIERKGFITLSEPAAGAGGMVLAAAQVIVEEGFDPAQVMFFVATDVAKICANMTFIQTSMLGLSGIVQHANSLSQEVWSYRFTPICRVYPKRTNVFLADIQGEVTESDSAEPVTGTPPATVPLQAPLELVVEAGEARADSRSKAVKVDKLLPQEESLFVQGSLF